MYVCGLGDERALFLKKRENPPSAGSVPFGDRAISRV